METIKISCGSRLRVAHFGSGVLQREPHPFPKAEAIRSTIEKRASSVSENIVAHDCVAQGGLKTRDIYCDSIFHELAHKVIILVIRRTMRCHGGESLRGRSRMKECKNWTIFGRGYNGANKACRSFGGFSSLEITWSSRSTITTPAGASLYHYSRIDIPPQSFEVPRINARQDENSPTTHFQNFY